LKDSFFCGLGSLLKKPSGGNGTLFKNLIEKKFDRVERGESMEKTTIIHLKGRVLKL
jgi:hypothetical protein